MVKSPHKEGVEEINIPTSEFSLPYAARACCWSQPTRSEKAQRPVNKVQTSQPPEAETRLEKDGEEIWRKRADTWNKQIR